MANDEEEIEDYIPVQTVHLFAHSVLGIDLETEQDLLFVAEDALHQLPAGWQVHIEQTNMLAYFFNEATQESVWIHPEAGKWKKRL